MSVIYKSKILLKTGYGYPGNILDLGEFGYDVSNNKAYVGNGIGFPPSGITMDLSLNSLWEIVNNLEASTGNYVTQSYADGSLNAKVNLTLFDSSILSLTNKDLSQDASISQLLNISNNLETSIGNLDLLTQLHEVSLGNITQSNINRDLSINLLFTENDIQDSSLIDLRNRINSIDGSIIFMDSSINQLFSQKADLTYVDGSLNAKVNRTLFDSSILILANVNISQDASILLRPLTIYVDGSLSSRDSSIGFIFNNGLGFIKDISLGNDFYYQSGLLEVSIGSILNPGKNLTLDTSGNISVVNSPNFSGDVSISQSLFIDQKIFLNDYTLANASAGNLWWDEPRLFFKDGSANRDILQGSLKGTIYPSSPSEGDIFYRTDNGLLFVYDGSRGKYLSATRSTITGGRTTAVAGSTIYIRIGDATQSSTTGYRMIRNGTITGFSVQNNNILTSARDIAIRINDTTVITANIPIGQRGANLNQLNTDFNIGDLIQISAEPGVAGSALSSWIVLLEFATRS